MRARKILILLLIVWVAIRVHYVVRETLRKDYLDDYRALLSRGLEGKRSYVTGDRLYEFISFCRSRLPSGSAFRLVGIKEDSIDRIRAIYYLYPNVEDNTAEYLLVYDAKDAPSIGYRLFARLDRDRYILRKGGGR